MDPTFLVMSMSEWKKLGPNEQAVLTKGAQLGAEIVRAMAPVREAEALATVKKLGMKVHEIDLRAAAEGVGVGAGRSGPGLRRPQPLLAEIRKLQ